MRDLRTWDELQSLVGLGTEAADLDFKETLDPKANGFMVELGKDLAALANTLGGHIVVGVSTELNRTRCTGFHGLNRELGSELAGHFERAAKDRCRPTPFISTQLTDLPGDAEAKVVLVVRVEASAIAPVGASVEQRQGGKLVDQAWVFPYRVGSQTEYLTPDQFGAFESMTARRAAALLDAIPLDERGAIDLCSAASTGSSRGKPVTSENTGSSRVKSVTLESIDSRLNVATFRAPSPPISRYPTSAVAEAALRPLLRLALDSIVTAWPENPGRWTVVVRGYLRLEQGSAGQTWIYDPCGALD